MKPLYTILFLFYVTASFAQRKTVTGIFYANGDTSYAYKYQIEVIKRLSLPSLDTAAAHEYYRLRSPNQVLDIWEAENGSVSGLLTNWVSEHVHYRYDKKPTNRVFVKKMTINPDTAQLIRELFISSNMINLPTDDSIKGWKQGTDGITYAIEQASQEQYTFKTYWTPEAQGSLKEAKQVQKFIDAAFGLAKAQTIWENFEKAIPYECYGRGGMSIICKVLTSKERRQYARERKNYHRTVTPD